jgi:hypothetical protein
MASDSVSGGFHDEVKTKTIRIFHDHISADIAASKLKANGIECWIHADDCGGMYPNLTGAGGVRLIVQIADAEAANELLEAQAEPVNESGDAPGFATVMKDISEQENRTWSVPIILALGIFSILLFLNLWTGKIGTKTVYHHKNGKVESRWNYRNGYLFSFFVDRNLDGAWDTWNYYEDGERTRSEYDNNFDGKPDVFWTYSDGAVVKMEKDTDFNGVPDEFYTYKFEVPLQCEIRPNRSQFVTQRYLYKDGVLVQILRGGDRMGNFEESVFYDPFGNPFRTNMATFKLLPGTAK